MLYRYNSNPKSLTGTQLKEDIKKQKMRNEDKIFQKNSKAHKDIVTRIQEKEDAMFSIREMKNDNPTFKNKLEMFRKDNIDQFSQKFGKVTIGVHGRELPKFTDNTKEYWKLKDGYQDTYVFISLLVVLFYTCSMICIILTYLIKRHINN